MRARLAAVVMSIDEIYPETLEPLHALASRTVVRQCGPDLSVVQRNGRQEDACAIQKEVAAVYPELAKTETLRIADIQ